MAQGPDSKEKVVYVGDSRVRKRTNTLVPKDYSAYPGKSEAFIPNFLLKEWMVGVVVLVGFLALVISEPPPLGYPADPMNTAFIPIPDWYFLFMYQLLKYPYLSKDFVVLGTIGLPGALFGALMLAPFLDTGKERRFYRRPIASALMLLSIVAVIYLTKVSWDHYTMELERNGLEPEHITRERIWKEEREAARQSGDGQAPKRPTIVAADDPGAKVYQKATCIHCHGDDLKGKQGAPTLLGIGDKMDKDTILTVIHNGIGTMGPQYDMLIQSGLTDEEIDTLAAWLAMQKTES